MDRNETIIAIRTALKNRSGKQWSVTGGTGTAWGWIKISVPPSRRGCAMHHQFAYDTCEVCGADRFTAGLGFCEQHVCNTGRYPCGNSSITPADRKELAELLSLKSVDASGESVPASSAYYREYIARAGGLNPSVCGKQYWD